ncbi:ATP-binding protein [Streptomyces sp. NPDC002514]|uniref:ATP-binding protein n=1 Tax=Streptomyces sp. NPDC001270 TaxID=3364554 RepID=UPI003689F647
MDKRVFGRLLREARQRSLLTLEDLSGVSGVSVRAISDMERGRSLPRQATLGDLMDALELDEEARRHLVQASVRRVRQVPQQLPPDPAVFRGRTEALRAAHGVTGQSAAVGGGHVVIAAVAGMAGVGKTTLAVHWAHEVAEHFPDGQLFVNLRGFEDSGRPLEPGEALGGFLGALGVPSSEIPSGTEERAALFKERTASRRLIVVLDNARDSQQVRPLLPASAGCLTIVTSRNRLSGLVAREGASPIGLEVWTPIEAVAALAARIGQERCWAEPEAAAELVALCGYLPLAVAVVGAQLSTAPGMPLRLGVRELRQARPRLDALTADDRRVDVRAVFSWSYRALTEEAARFFRHLALHPGPAVSAEAAASLAGVELPAARRHLRELISASLLSRDAEGHYVLHDLVRAYGVELMEQEDDDRLAAETRLLDYLHHNARTANRFATQFTSEPTPAPVAGAVQVAIDSREEGLDWFRQEESVAAAAVRLLVDPRLLGHRINVTQEWMAYNAVAGRWTEEIWASRIGLDAALVLDDPVAVVTSGRQLARALCETGQLGLADEPVALILNHLHRIPLEHQARAERSVSWARAHQKRYTEALPHGRRALSIARTLGQRHETGLALTQLGWVLAMLGDHRRTIALCEEALSVLGEVGDRRNQGVAWSNIGYAQQCLGDLDAAFAGHRQALRIFEAVDDPYSQAEALDYLAAAHLERGDTEQARASWTRAAELFSVLRIARAAEMRSKAAALPLPRPETHPAAG